MRSYTDIKYKSNELPLELHLPDSEEFSLFIYFHGGGLTSSSYNLPKKFYAPTLCAHNVGIANVEYTLYPKAKYTDFIEDCADAVAWVFNNIEKYGKCRSIFVGGASAGAYISMMLEFDGEFLRARGIDPLDVKGYIHNAGQPTTHFKVLDAERGITDRARVIADEKSPIFHAGEAENYSPMLIINADNDSVNRYEQTQLFMSTLKYLGYEDKITFKLMHGTHCSYDFENDENGENVFSKLIIDFIESVEKK